MMDLQKAKPLVRARGFIFGFVYLYLKFTTRSLMFLGL